MYGLMLDAKFILDLHNTCYVPDISRNVVSILKLDYEGFKFVIGDGVFTSKNIHKSITKTKFKTFIIRFRNTNKISRNIRRQRKYCGNPKMNLVPNISLFVPTASTLDSFLFPMVMVLLPSIGFRHERNPCIQPKL